MFEIDQYEHKLHNGSATSPGTPYSFSDNIDKISLLFWGEHCMECTAPACYQTCDLFEARPDTRCRRFHFGIYMNRQFRSLRGYGAEVSFKKWGVIAAVGNTAMVPLRRVLLVERIIGITAPMVNAIGPLINRLTHDSRWTYPTFGLSRRYCSWLHRRNSRRTKPDAFLLEVFNPANSLNVQLTMDFAPDARNKLETTVQIQPRFRMTLPLASGYSRHEFDQRLFQGFTDSGLPFNISITPEGDTSPRLIFLTADFVTYKKKQAADQTQPGIKCVVWDLDNTMWDGTLLEGDDVRLKPHVKEIVQTLDRRGILSSISSKNDHDAAWHRLEAFGIADYFLVPQINWKPKSENIRTIAKRLNIGLDSFAFVDDTPFELSEVASAIPEVTCISVADVDQVSTGARFQGSNTADGQKRREYYKEAIVREEKQSEFGEDYHRFLEYCEIKLDIRFYQDDDFDRVAELVQRTNQLNFSGRKYRREELREVLNDATMGKYILYCSDRFGSYGLIGFGMVRATQAELQVQDLMLSCRVQGKLIEQVFCSHLEKKHNITGARRLRVMFNETSRNQPARQALEAAGFVKAEVEVGFVRDMSRPEGREEVVRVSCAACNSSVPIATGEQLGRARA